MKSEDARHYQNLKKTMCHKVVDTVTEVVTEVTTHMVVETHTEVAIHMEAVTLMEVVTPMEEIEVDQYRLEEVAVLEEAQMTEPYSSATSVII